MISNQQQEAGTGTNGATRNPFPTPQKGWRASLGMKRP